MKRLFFFALVILLSVFNGAKLHAKAVLPEIAPEKVLGTTGYYHWRYDDFMKRHPGLSEPDSQHIPDYYLEYGAKYVIRFTEKLYPKLSDKGKAWLIAARLNLQLAMEEELKKNLRKFARLEENPKAFAKFAYGTHQASYLDAGLSGLPLSDLIKIGMTPDLKDLISKNGISQIFAIGLKLSKAYAKRLFKFIRHASKLVTIAAQTGNFLEVDQAIKFVEQLPLSDQKMIAIVTSRFKEIRQAIQFRQSHKEGSESWNKLLDRLNRLGKK